MGHDGRLTITNQSEGGSAMKITTLGIDLAKNVFRVHGCDARGKVVVSKSLTRRQLAEFISLRAW